MRALTNGRLHALTESVFAELETAKRRLLAEGRTIIDLGIGSPDQPPDAALRALLAREVQRDDVYGYAIMGQPELLESIADWYRRRFGVLVDPATQVTDLMGSQDGLAHIFLALVEPGDVVLVPDPAYPIHRVAPLLAGAEIYPLPLRPENDFLPDLAGIPPAVLNRARAIVLNYPSNPTTAVVDRAFFVELARWADHWGIWVLHDAAYSELAFDGYRPPSFLEAPGACEVGIEFNSLSKTFNLAGCRVGYAVGCATLIRALKTIKSHLDYGTFIPIQRVAARALQQPLSAAQAVAAVYQRRRDALVGALAQAGWVVSPPKATMFCWARLPQGFDDARAFALALLDRAGVIVAPGTGFGPAGQGYVRIALVADEERLREAARRIAASGLLDGAGQRQTG